MPNVQSTSSASLLYKAFLTLLGCDEIIRYTTSTRSRPVDDWLPKEKIVIHQLHGKTLKIPPSLFSVPLLSMGKRGIIYKTYNKVFLFSLRLGLNRLCSHNLKLCFGRHPISKDWMVYEIHLRHSKCHERLRPCHPHILPGQPCRSVQVLDFGTLLFLQAKSHWYRVDLQTSTKSEPASLSIVVRPTRSNVEVISPLAHIFSL